MSGTNQEGESPRTIVEVSKLISDIKTKGHNCFTETIHREPVYWVGDVRHRDGASLIQALEWNCGNSGS